VYKWNQNGVLTERGSHSHHGAEFHNIAPVVVVCDFCKHNVSRFVVLKTNIEFIAAIHPSDRSREEHSIEWKEVMHLP
jgi:hypothetical protein